MLISRAYSSYPISRNQLFHSKIINKVMQCVGVWGQCIIIIKPINLDVPHSKLIVSKDCLFIYKSVICRLCKKVQNIFILFFCKYQYLLTRPIVHNTPKEASSETRKWNSSHFKLHAEMSKTFNNLSSHLALNRYNS